MSDLSLVWTEKGGVADLGLLGVDLATEEGLRTACIISLFSDRLAREDDVLPDNSGDRRGWWGDAFADVTGDLIGSRLWLLDRSKQVPATLVAAEDYAAEALAWAIEDGLATGVMVRAEWTGAGQLGLEVALERPNADRAVFYFVWEATA